MAHCCSNLRHTIEHVFNNGKIANIIGFKLHEFADLDTPFLEIANLALLPPTALKMNLKCPERLGS